MLTRLAVASAVVGLFAFAGSAGAAIESREVLKTYFETGDVPTQDQFDNLIDSLINVVDDRYLLGLRVYNPQISYNPGDTVIAKKAIYGATVQTPLAECVTADRFIADHLHVDMSTDFAGQHGYLELVFGDSLGTYYGYMQLTMEPDPGVAPGPGIFVEYIVIETTPFQAIQIAEVPEPASLTFMGGAAMLLLARRRR